jgi:thymidylate synthase ThyX
MYEAMILADSISSGVRLTSMAVTFPRIILAEVNTHRMFSRSSASSRAIPVEKRIAAVRADPFVPAAFGSNKRGMQAGENLGDVENSDARADWEEAMEAACNFAESMSRLGVHKQWANRLIEPFAWTTAVITATEWANFFALRISPLAQPEMQTTAAAMKAAMDGSKPRELKPGQWHLPYIDWDEAGGIEPLALAKISSARCARVSYLTQDGKRDIKADLELHDRLLAAGHMSPYEHPAKAVTPDFGNPLFSPVYVADPQDPSMSVFSHFMSGNLRAPFVQYRKQLPNEAVFTGGA